VAIEEQIPVRETTARLRHVSISPPKMRLVLELIRGQDVETARDTLRFCDRSAAGSIAKLLDSAVANAEHNDDIPEEELFIARAYADEGPTQKRWRPRARGRGVRIRKRTSHVTLVVARFGEEDLELRRRSEAAGARERRRLARRRPGRAVEASPDAGEEPVDVDEAPEGADAEDTAAETAPAPAKKRTAKKTTAKKTTTKKSTAEKAPAKKSPAKKATGEPAKKSTAKKTTAKKSPTKRAPKTTEDED